MIWGGGPWAPARNRQQDGAEVIAWPGADPSALVRAGVPVRPVEAVLGDAGLAAADVGGRTWTRLWGRLPLVDGMSFRELATWRDMSLLWLAEGFIRAETAGPRCAELVEIALRLLEATRASEVDVAGLSGPDAVLLDRACTASGVLFHGKPPRARPLRPPLSSRPGRLRTLQRVLAPATPPPLPSPLGETGPPPVRPLLVLVPADDDGALRSLFDAVTRELALPVVMLPLPNLARWRTRRVVHEAARAAGPLRELSKRLRGATGVLDSYRHREVKFSDLAADDLDRILHTHLPGAILRLESAIELFSVAPRPLAVALAAGGLDERRTLLAACAVTGLPSLVIHTRPVGPDERERADGGPQADVTLVWEPGSDTAPVLDRLREVVRARVERE